MYMYIHIYIYTCTCTHDICECIYTYVYTYVHTYGYTYTHTSFFPVTWRRGLTDLLVAELSLFSIVPSMQNGPQWWLHPGIYSLCNSFPLSVGWTQWLVSNQQKAAKMMMSLLRVGHKRLCLLSHWDSLLPSWLCALMKPSAVWRGHAARHWGSL